ncbi:MAG: PKD domain-containing protein, partial [Bacteroidia bacterium]
MDEVTPTLYNWNEIETKFSKRLNITNAECKSFFRYAAKWNYLTIENYKNLVKEGAITKANAQQYWLDKLFYFENLYKFKYLPAVEEEKIEAEKREIDLKNGVSGNKTASSSCNNLDFSAGNTSNWTGQWNNLGSALNQTDPTTQPPQVYGYGNLTVNGLNSGGFNSMSFVHEICNGGTDPLVPINRVPPGHSYSLRLGSDSAYWAAVAVNNGQNYTYPAPFPFYHQIISNTFSVTAASQTITYWYAVVLDQTGTNGHPTQDQPYFKIRMYDASGQEITCARYDVDVTQASSIGGFQNLYDATGNYQFFYKNWTPVLIPLLQYVGQTVTITFETIDCDKGGHFGYAYIAVDCAPLALVTHLPQPCVGGNTTMTAPAGLATYNWTGPGVVGVNTMQTATVNVGGTYSVTMTTYANSGQTGCTLILGDTIHNSTVSPVASFSATTQCLHNATQFTDQSTLLANQGTLNHWSWNFGDGGTSTSNNPTHTYTAAGTFPVTYTIGSSVGCTATYTDSVIVNPLPSASFISDTVCKQLITTFTNTSTGGVSYNWNFGDGTIASTLQNPTHSYINSGTFVTTLTVT